MVVDSATVVWGKAVVTGAAVVAPGVVVAAAAVVDAAPVAAAGTVAADDVGGAPLLVVELAHDATTSAPKSPNAQVNRRKVMAATLPAPLRAVVANGQRHRGGLGPGPT